MSRPGTFLKRWLVVIIWMSVIFSASSDTASFQHSSRILGPIVRWLFPSWPENRVEDAVFFLRKCAHFTEFAILAMFVWRALQKARPKELQQAQSITGKDNASAQSSKGCDSWRWRTALVAWAIVVAYAISDELHQYFVPTRQASVIDVLIDSGGAFTGLVLVWAYYRVRRRC